MTDRLDKFGEVSLGTRTNALHHVSLGRAFPLKERSDPLQEADSTQQQRHHYRRGYPRTTIDPTRNYQPQNIRAKKNTPVRRPGCY